MQVLKVHVLIVCEACQGKAFEPVGEAIDNQDKPYVRYAACSQCNGSGKQEKWIGLEEFLIILSTVQPNPHLYQLSPQWENDLAYEKEKSK